MDPNACLARIANARGRERSIAIHDLHVWISKGGFAPRWKDHPGATASYVRDFGLAPGMPGYDKKPRYTRAGRIISDGGLPIVYIERIVDTDGRAGMTPVECDELAAHLVKLLNANPIR